MRISEFITASNRTYDENALFSLLDQALNQTGLDAGYAYGALTHFNAYDFKTPFLGPAITSTYSPQWIEHYMKMNYAAIDPTVTLAPKVHGAFQWDNIKATDSAGQTFLSEAKHDADLKQGVCIPLHGPYGDTFAISTASSSNEKLSPDTLSTLFIICTQFHQAFLRINRHTQKKVSLTCRQCECLLWVAANKSNWEIGVIVGIEERTVRFHLEKAFARLTVTSREEAVVKAIMLGLINP